MFSPLKQLVERFRPHRTALSRPRSAPAAYGRRLACEPLEDRRLLSVVPFTIPGTAGDDFLVIRPLSADSFEYELNGTPFGPEAGVTSIEFEGLGGNDLLVLDTSISDELPTGGIAFVIRGTNDDNQLLLTPSAANSFSYQFDGVNGSFMGDAAIKFDAAGGKDQLEVDFSQFEGLPTGGIVFAAGAPGEGNRLALTGGSFFSVTHTFVNANDGYIDIDGGMIEYTGLDPIDDNLDAADRVFTFLGGAETITLSDDIGNAGMSFIDSDHGESVSFRNPTASLTIDTTADADSDTINIEGLDAAFDADLIVKGKANDTVTFQTNPTDLGSGDLSISAGTVTQTAGAAITAAGLELLGAGPYTLTNAGNNVTSLGAYTTGAISYRDSASLTIGTVEGTTGITTKGNITLIVGASITFPAGIAIAAPQGTVTLNIGTDGTGKAKLAGIIQTDGSPVRVNGGDRRDTLELSLKTLELSPNRAGVPGIRFDGGGGDDKLVVHGTDDDDAFCIKDGAVGRVYWHDAYWTAHSPLVQYQNVEQLEFDTLAGNDQVTFSLDHTKATTLKVDGGVGNEDAVRLIGTAQDDTIVVGDYGSGERFQIRNVEWLQVFGVGGNNTIDASKNTTAESLLVGGDGNDTIYGGTFAPPSTLRNVIFGGKGDDILHGGPGKDYIFADHSFNVDRSVSPPLLTVIDEGFNENTQVFGNGGPDVIVSNGGKVDGEGQGKRYVTGTDFTIVDWLFAQFRPYEDWPEVAAEVIAFPFVKPFVPECPPASVSQIGVWRNGWFNLDVDGDGRWNPAVDESARFGEPDHTPIIGDWNGDGVSQIGVYRNGWFSFDMDGDGQWNPAVDQSIRFGGPDRTPIIGDWNGDGVSQIGVWRNGWFSLNDNGEVRSFRFGSSDHTPIIGDWNGDGADQIGVYRNGWFNLDMDGDGVWNPAVDKSIRFGGSGATPIIGDWNAAAALHAASAPPTGQPATEPITLAELQPVVEEAILRMTDDLESIAFQVQIADLPGLKLAETFGNTILVDRTAAGFGWYAETTDADFQPGGRYGELTAQLGTAAAQRVDLLTAVMHEMGHLLGHDHASDGLMQPALGPGVRRLPADDLAWLDELGQPGRRDATGRALEVRAIDEALTLSWE